MIQYNPRADHARQSNVFAARTLKKPTQGSHTGVVLTFMTPIASLLDE